MFHGISKYLIVNLVFSHLGFWSGNLFLIAPFPDLCLLVPFNDLHTFSLVYLSFSELHAPPFIVLSVFHYENMPMQYTENFLSFKN